MKASCATYFCVMVITKWNLFFTFFRKESEGTEQMCKYYYCLLQNNLHTFAQVSPGNELKVEAFIRKCKSADSASITNVDSSVWQMLSRDLMVSSEMWTMMKCWTCFCFCFLSFFCMRNILKKKYCACFRFYKLWFLIVFFCVYWRTYRTSKTK